MSKKYTVIRGDDRGIDVTVKDKTGTVIDITGGTIFFTVSASESPANDDDALITKDVTSHTDAVNGLSTIELTSTQTNITPGEYYYDIQFVDSSGKVSSKQKGDFVVESDITRRTS